jgi:hypothetical protein
MEKMLKDYDMMVDMEGLSDYGDGVVLSIAMVPFKMRDNNTFDELLNRSLYLKLDAKDQIKKGRQLAPRTVEWWKSQSKEAQQILIPTPDDVLIEDALNRIDEFSAEWYDYKNSMFWSRGIQYDWTLFQDMYRRNSDRDPPLNSWSIHDTKTHIRVLTGDKYSRYELESGKPKGFIAHNALHDACLEVLKIQELYRKFFT